MHGLTHPFLDKLDSETIFNELYYDKKNIEEWFGKEVVGMAYPYGTYNDEVIKIAREVGIKYARTAGTSMKFTVPEDLMKYTGTCHFSNADIFGLIDEFEKLPDDASGHVLYIWGHTYEFDVLKKWDLLKDILERLKTVDAKFVTNREAFGL